MVSDIFLGLWFSWLIWSGGATAVELDLLLCVFSVEEASLTPAELKNLAAECLTWHHPHQTGR